MARLCRGFAVATALFVPCAQAETMDRVVFDAGFAREKSSYCLDGTPAGYYVHENPDSKGWVIYLQGGGLCVTPFDCAARAKNGGKEGSSLKWDATFSDTTNVLSDSPDNPFRNYSKVWVPYCSGDTYTGTTLKNKYLGGLHTTGHYNVKAVLDHLANTTGFKHADNLLLSGGSAGGIGVFHNADFVGDYIKTALGINVTYKCAPQAGWFFPGGIFLYEEWAVGLRVPFDFFATDAVHFIELGYVNEECEAALGKKSKQCWDVNVVQKYLATPFFVAQNQLDSNQISDELLCPGSTCKTDTKPASVAGKFMRDYSLKSVASLQAFQNEHPGGGVFSPSCLAHVGDLCMTRGPLIQGVSYGQSLGAWYFETGGFPTTLYDSCGDGEIICNPSCTGGAPSGCGDSLDTWPAKAKLHVVEEAKSI